MTDNDEPIQDVAHLGHVELLTPKPSESLWYFTDILGMESVHSEGQSVYLRGYGDYAAMSLKLTEAKDAGIGHIAWRAVSEQALERRAQAIEETGFGIGWSNGDFGHGRCYRFNDPDGHLMEIYFDEDKYAPPDHLRSALKNLPMKYPKNGIGVRRTDHVALLCKDVEANRNFVSQALGLKLREQVVYENGAREIGSWMSSSPVHHEVAYVVDVKGMNGRLHHLSLWVDEQSEVLRAADIIKEHGIFLEAGPAKHNNSQAFYIYSYEPGGNRVEIYTSGFFVFAPDFEPIVWDETSRGTGVYWGGALPDSFLNYATPDSSESETDPVDPVPVFDPR